jgi:hypothetical protein
MSRGPGARILSARLSIFLLLITASTVTKAQGWIEEVAVQTLPDPDAVLAHFRFSARQRLRTPSEDARGGSYDIKADVIPAALLRLIGNHPVEDLHLTLTRGRWKHALPPPSWLSIPPPGLELHLHVPKTTPLHNATTTTSTTMNDMDIKFQSLSETLAALTGAAVPSLARHGVLTAPTVGWLQERAIFGRRAISAALPTEFPCMDSVAAWLRLLPCGSQAGLAAALTPERVVQAPLHSLQLRVTAVKEDAESLRSKDKASQTGVDAVLELTLVLPSQQPQHKEGRHGGVVHDADSDGEAEVRKALESADGVLWRTLGMPPLRDSTLPMCPLMQRSIALLPLDIEDEQVRVDGGQVGAGGRLPGCRLQSNVTATARRSRRPERRRLQVCHLGGSKSKIRKDKECAEIDAHVDVARVCQHSSACGPSQAATTSRPTKVGKFQWKVQASSRGMYLTPQRLKLEVTVRVEASTAALYESSPPMPTPTPTPTPQPAASTANTSTASDVSRRESSLLDDKAALSTNTDASASYALIHLSQAVPWGLGVGWHTLRISLDGRPLRPPMTSSTLQNGNEDGRLHAQRQGLVWTALRPSMHRRRGALVEALLRLPHATFESHVTPRDSAGALPTTMTTSSVVRLEIELERQLLTVFDLPPDASRGIDVPAASITLVPPLDEASTTLAGRHPHYREGIHGNEFSTATETGLSTLLKRVLCGQPVIATRGDPFLVSLPIPDASMPFNVVCFTSTAVGLTFGSLLSTLLREMGSGESGSGKCERGFGGRTIRQRLKRGAIAVVMAGGAALYLDKSLRREAQALWERALISVNVTVSRNEL